MNLIVYGWLVCSTGVISYADNFISFMGDFCQLFQGFRALNL